MIFQAFKQFQEIEIEDPLKDSCKDSLALDDFWGQV